MTRVKEENKVKIVNFFFFSPNSGIYVTRKVNTSPNPG